MKYSTLDLTAACGLYCGDCIRLDSKASKLAAELREELEKTDFRPYAETKALTVPEMEHYEDSLKVMEKLAGLLCNAPCRVGGGCSGFECEILVCCTDKGYEGCWECDDSESCSKFEFLNPYSGENRPENLRKIKELGLENWVSQRKPFYTWQ